MNIDELTKYYENMTDEERAAELHKLRLARRQRPEKATPVAKAPKDSKKQISLKEEMARLEDI